MDTDRSAARWVELSEQIAVCGRLIGSAFAPASERWGLTGAQLSLLLVCRHGQPAGLAQTELAQRLGISPAHVSAQVESLRLRSLLESRRPNYDRRRQVWRLTERGAALVDSVLAELAPRVATMVRHLGADQFDELTHLLDLLQGALQHPEAPDAETEPRLQSFDPAQRSGRQAPVPQSHRDHSRRAAS